MMYITLLNKIIRYVRNYKIHYGHRHQQNQNQDKRFLCASKIFQYSQCCDMNVILLVFCGLFVLICLARTMIPFLLTIDHKKGETWVSSFGRSRVIVISFWITLRMSIVVLWMWFVINFTAHVCVHFYRIKMKKHEMADLNGIKNSL